MIIIYILIILNMSRQLVFIVIKGLRFEDLKKKIIKNKLE